MFNKRLLQQVPEALKFIIASVAMKLVSLLAYVAFFFSLAGLLQVCLEQASAEVLASALQSFLVTAGVTIPLRFAGTSLASYFGSKASAAGKATIRRDAYDKLIELGASHKESISSAKAVSICGEGAEKLQVYLGQYMPQLFYSVLAPITLFIVFVRVNWLAALILLICVPLIPVSIVAIMKIAKRVMGEYWDSYVDLGGNFLESIQALTTLKVFKADEAKQADIAKQAEGFRITTMKLLRVQLNSVTVMDLFTFGGAAVGVVVVLWQFSQSAISVADALAFVFLAIEFFLPMRILGSFFHTAMGASPVIDDFFELLDTPNPNLGKKTLTDKQLKIEVENVSYSYPGADKLALHDINFSVEPNSFVGITGESGSGKSTLAGILSGTLIRYDGSIKIGGIEVREIETSSLHDAVTHVASQSHIFKGTFRTNLLMGNPNANDYAMWGALGKCHMDDFVLSLGGLDAPIAESGANLSGGQRQRLAVARALLRDTPIYIFDEATSNIDAESERDILTLVQKLAFDKTVILISHRLAALGWADNIFVLENGTIVEEGDHSTLLKTDGPYAKLWSTQENFEQLAAQIEQARASMTAAAGEAQIDVPEKMAEALEKMPPQIAAATKSIMKGARIRALSGEGGAMPAGHPEDIPIPTVQPKKEAEARKRSVFEVIWGLLRLYGNLTPLVLRSTIFATIGFALAIFVSIFASRSIVSTPFFNLQTSFAIIALLIIASGVFRGFFRYLERLISHDETFQTLAVIRDKVFQHMRKLAPARLEARDTADLISLLSGDIELLEVFYAHTISPVLVAILTSVGLAIYIACQSAQLALVAILIYVLVGFVFPLILNRWIEKDGRDLKDRIVRFSSFMFESLVGLPEILEYGYAQTRRDELGGRMGALSKNEKAVSRKSAIAMGLTDVLILLGIVASVYVAVSLVSAGEISGSAALLAIVALSVSFDPLIALANLGSSLNQTIASGERVLNFLDEKPETLDVIKGEVLTSFKGANVDAIDFSYDDEVILSDFSIEIPEGKIVHIAGPSGSGKSTLLKLLMRFWDVETGTVSISGKDIKSITTSSLRDVESYMTQTTQLFSGSIRENIVFVKPEASEEELDAAVKKASLGSFVSRLPKGLDTTLGELGEGLSEGEKQRIGLARIFLYDAPFVLLDEPTSNLDCLNEAAVLQSLHDGREGKTILMVSHRSSGAALADISFNIDQGRLS